VVIRGRWGLGWVVLVFVLVRPGLDLGPKGLDTTKRVFYGLTVVLVVVRWTDVFRQGFNFKTFGRDFVFLGVRVFVHVEVFQKLWK
jgi:hypothetical protein